MPDLESLLKTNMETLFAKKDPIPAAPPELDGIKTRRVRRIVTYLNTYYVRHNGKYPTLDKVSAECRLPKEEVIDLIEEEIQGILDGRGLPYFDVAGETHGLDPEFIAICNLIADPRDGKPTAAKLKMMGKTTTWWTNMLCNSDHRDYYEARVQEVWDTQIKTEAKAGMARLVAKDDLNAIKYYHEYTGEFNPAQNQVLSLQLIIQMLMEILAPKVDGPVLAQIADEIEKAIPQLGAGNAA